MSLDRRIRDLESVIGCETCPACGTRLDGSVTFRVAGRHEAGFAEPPCEVCGNPFRFTLDLGETLREAGGSRAIGSM